MTYKTFHETFIYCLFVAYIHINIFTDIISPTIYFELLLCFKTRQAPRINDWKTLSVTQLAFSQTELILFVIYLGIKSN